MQSQKLILQLVVFWTVCGPTVGIFVLSYIQDNLSWVLGFGIPCIIMGFALVTFLIGTMTYRFGEKTEEKSPFIRIGQVFVKAARNWRSTPSAMSSVEQECGTLAYQDSWQFRFLNKALVSLDGSEESGTVCSLNEVEEAKSVLRLIPIWASCLVYAILFAQTTTLFTKQGATVDRSIGPTFKIPPATLQSFIGISVIILIPIYDTLLVPLTRSLTTIPSGITTLQRIGTGIIISILSMVVAGFIETKRLETARGYGLADDLRSVGLALYLSVFLGVGSFMSGFLILVVEKITGGNGGDGWISDNVNRGHIDYFYYLLVGISAGAFVMYVYAAKSYVYNRGRGL